MSKDPKRYTIQDAIQKLEHYCSYQDRCHSEVKQKLYELKLDAEDQDEVLLHLIQSDHLNEERFARAFVRGRFRMKKWGRNKIRLKLKEKRVSEYCIKKGMEEINEEQYMLVLDDALQAKWKTLKDKNHFTKKQKLIRFGVQRGFELPLIYDWLGSLK